jgi:hypothetical protein
MQIKGKIRTEISIPDTYEKLSYDLNQLKEFLTCLAEKLVANEMNGCSLAKNSGFPSLVISLC